MARRVPPDRLAAVTDVAARVFIDRGYRQTRMADVAAELELSSGSLYNYVESKEALLHLVVEHGLGRRPPALDLPVPTPTTGATLRLVEERLRREFVAPSLQDALTRERADDIRAEVAAVLAERYDTVERTRDVLMLVERCAPDIPGLGGLFFRRGRRGATADMVTYLSSRIDAGQLRPVPDVLHATRYVEEAIAWFAMHRYRDQDSAMLDDALSRQTAVELGVNALVMP